MTEQKNTLVQKLISEASCQYRPEKPRDERQCGRKHGQLEAGQPVSLFSAWQNLNFKGHICNHCIRLLSTTGEDMKTYSFVPIAIMVGLISDNSRKTTTNDSRSGGSGTKKDAASAKSDNKRKRHGKHDKGSNARPRECQPAQPAAPAAVVPGGAWEMLVTKYGLPREVFDAALKTASESGKSITFIEALRQDPQGREAIAKWQAGSRPAHAPHAECQARA